VTEFELEAAPTRSTTRTRRFVRRSKKRSPPALEFQARQWNESRRIDRSAAARQQAGALVQEAAAIDKEVARLRELRRRAATC